MPNIYVPQVDIMGPYYRSLEGIGQGIGSIAGAYFGSKYAKERKKKEEEEAYQRQKKREEEIYQLGMSREEKDYRLKKQREREEAGERRRQATELLTKKYQGYQLANPPLRISEIQPLSRAGQRMEESPSSLAHLLRARLENMTPRMVEKTEVPDIPENLGEGIYGDIIKKALIQQGLLPGQSEWASAGDGTLYNKYTPETKRIPGWTPKAEPPYKVGARHKFTGDDGLTYEGTFKGLDKDSNPVWDKVVKVKNGEGEGGGGATFTKIEGEAFADFMKSGYNSLTPQKKAIVDNRLNSDSDWGLAVKLAMDDIRIMQKPAAERVEAMMELHRNIKAGIDVRPYRDTGKTPQKPLGGTPPYSGIFPLFPWDKQNRPPLSTFERK